MQCNAETDNDDVVVGFVDIVGVAVVLLDGSYFLFVVIYPSIHIAFR
jgi:hypothetical protein